LTLALRGDSIGVEIAQQRDEVFTRKAPKAQEIDR
jgi:hypothetical protein